MFGYTAAEAIGRQGILTPAELRQQNAHNLELLMAGEIPPVLNTQRLTRDGQRLDVSISEAPVRNQNNELIGYATIIRDISAQKCAEQALIESERRLAGFVESAMDAIITVDEQHRICVFNQAACQIFRCTTAEAMGAPIEDFMPARFRDTHAAHMRSFGEDGVTTRSMGRTGKVHALRRDGSEFPVDASISQTMVAGRRMFSVILRDISEQAAAERVKAELEAQIREAQKMEALGTLSGGIAHDFNNILGAITGNLQLAREDLGNNPGAITSLDEIAKASTRAKELVKQILDFTRRETPDFKVHTVRPLIEESVRMMRATLPPSIQIKLGTVAETLTILANESQISQVLLNLCTNAWHAMADNKGSICLSVDSVELTRASTRRGITLQPGRYVRVAVEDDGSGMDAATQERIFEPFFTTKPVGQGTGLGLSVVHGIIRAHNGFINLKSAPGRGSTFEIFIPAAVTAIAAAVPLAAADTSNSKGGNQHIAYIDDDEAMVFLVKRLLTRRGFRVSTFDSGAAALTAVRAAPDTYDLVVTCFPYI
jgi:PAS domain S-box-containing protein